MGIAEFVVDRSEDLGSSGQRSRLTDTTSAHADELSRHFPLVRSHVRGSRRAAATPVEGQLLVTPEEAAHLLSIGRTSLYDLISSGDLHSVKIGRCRRVPVSSIVLYVSGLVERSHEG